MDTAASGHFLSVSCSFQLLETIEPQTIKRRFFDRLSDTLFLTNSFFYVILLKSAMKTDTNLLTRISTMTNRQVSPFNPSSNSQASGVNTMVFNVDIPSSAVRNYFAVMQSNLYSYRNGALFSGSNGLKATPQALVPTIAMAWIQTTNDLVSAKSDNYRNRMHEQLETISKVMAELNLRRECAQWAAQQTPWRG